MVDSSLPPDTTSATPSKLLTMADQLMNLETNTLMLSDSIDSLLDQTIMFISEYYDIDEALTDESGNLVDQEEEIDKKGIVDSLMDGIAGLFGASATKMAARAALKKKALRVKKPGKMKPGKMKPKGKMSFGKILRGGGLLGLAIGVSATIFHPSNVKAMDDYINPKTPSRVKRSGDRYDTLMDLIGQGEGGYESINDYDESKKKIVMSTHNAESKLGKPLEEHTIAQIMKLQEGGYGTRKVFAVGKYQIVPETMKDIVNSGVVKKSEYFTPETQDRMAMWLIMEKRPDLGAYLKGESDDIELAALELAKEWASFPNPEDLLQRSYYWKKGNKASHDLDEVYKVLRETRQDIQLFGSIEDKHTKLSSESSDGSTVLIQPVIVENKINLPAPYAKLLPGLQKKGGGSTKTSPSAENQEYFGGP